MPNGQRKASNTSWTEPAWSLRRRRNQTPVRARGGRGTKPARIRHIRRSQTPGSARGGRASGSRWRSSQTPWEAVLSCWGQTCWSRRASTGRGCYTKIVKESVGRESKPAGRSASVARLGVRDGQRAFVSGICGNLVFGPFASACSSQGNSQSIAGRTHVGHRKHSADNCFCKHSAQAAFEAASGCTVHLRLVPGKVHTGSRGWRAVHHISPAIGSADQGGREPPVEHSQRGTNKNKRPFFRVPEVQLCLVVLASGDWVVSLLCCGMDCRR